MPGRSPTQDAPLLLCCGKWEAPPKFETMWLGISVSPLSWPPHTNQVVFMQTTAGSQGQAFRGEKGPRVGTVG